MRRAGRRGRRRAGRVLRQRRRRVDLQDAVTVADPLAGEKKARKKQLENSFGFRTVGRRDKIRDAMTTEIVATATTNNKKNRQSTGSRQYWHKLRAHKWLEPGRKMIAVCSSWLPRARPGNARNTEPWSINFFEQDFFLNERGHLCRHGDTFAGRISQKKVTKGKSNIQVL